MAIYKHKCKHCAKLILEQPFERNGGFYIYQYCEKCISKLPARKKIIKDISRFVILSSLTKLVDNGYVDIVKKDNKEQFQLSEKWLKLISDRDGNRREKN